MTALPPTTPRVVTPPAPARPATAVAAPDTRTAAALPQVAASKPVSAPSSGQSVTIDQLPANVRQALEAGVPPEKLGLVAADGASQASPSQVPSAEPVQLSLGQRVAQAQVSNIQSQVSLQQNAAVLKSALGGVAESIKGAFSLLRGKAPAEQVTAAARQ